MHKIFLLFGALLVASAPVRAADFRNGLELVVACDTPSDQRLFFACLDAIVLRVSTLSGRGIKTCPQVRSNEDMAYWVVQGRKNLVGYWSRIEPPENAATLTPDGAIDALLRLYGYGPCIESTGS